MSKTKKQNNSYSLDPVEEPSAALIQQKFKQNACSHFATYAAAREYFDELTSGEPDGRFRLRRRRVGFDVLSFAPIKS